MSRKIVFLSAVLLTLTPYRPALADPPAEQQPPAQKPGLMSRFASLFDRLDTSKPENQYVIVVGGGDSEPAAAPAADQPATATASAAVPGSNNSPATNGTRDQTAVNASIVSPLPPAPTASATPTTSATANSPASTPAAAPASAHSLQFHGFTLSYGGDTDDAQKPAAAAEAKPPVASSKPAEQPQ